MSPSRTACDDVASRGAPDDARGRPSLPARAPRPAGRSRTTSSPPTGRPPATRHRPGADHAVAPRRPPAGPGEQPVAGGPAAAAGDRRRPRGDRRHVPVQPGPREPASSGPAAPRTPASPTATPSRPCCLWEVEVRGQRRARREGAVAALSRTEWEVAAAEQALAVQVIKAYGGRPVPAGETPPARRDLKLNEQLVDDVRRLVDAVGSRHPDLIMARSEVATPSTWSAPAGRRKRPPGRICSEPSARWAGRSSRKARSSRRPGPRTRRPWTSWRSPAGPTCRPAGWPWPRRPPTSGWPSANRYGNPAVGPAVHLRPDQDQHGRPAGERAPAGGQHQPRASVPERSRARPRGRTRSGRRK